MKGPRKTGGFKGGKQKNRAAPNKFFRRRPVRRGQLISPFGVGAIMDFRGDEALMCAGLDAWFTAAPPKDVVLNEERLQRKLGCSHFRCPPAYSEDEAGSHLKVPYVRFPLWHYCSRCFRMKKANLLGHRPNCDECKIGSNPRPMMPSRIIAICEEGHVEDFPYRTWVKCTCSDDGVAKLFFKAGRSSASLAGIKIECGTCGAKRSLAGSFEDQALQRNGTQCCGARPWLAEMQGAFACTEPLKAVQRGASNVYFPMVASSIYIPPPDFGASPEIDEALGMVWDLLMGAGLVNGEPNRGLCDSMAARANVDSNRFFAAAKAKLAQNVEQQIETLSEEQYRRQEFDVLSAGSVDARDLVCEPVDGAEYGWLGGFVEKVGLVRKLRETRVLVALSRINPKSDRTDRGVQPLSVNTIDWLPATEVRGEGIFIQFRDDKIMEWSTRADPRVRSMIDRYNQNRASRDLPPRNLDARFLLIHSLAHALIKELTFTCGYGSASLRERLYCNLEDPNKKMNGLLIYTASGDSEGSLGGLVNQGLLGNLEAVIADALRRSEWCSNDPVCIESPGQGLDIPNLAACHACMLVPETSCEEGNRLLDRALMVGTLDDEGLGYFFEAMRRW